MKLSKLLFICLFLISFSVYAQPSDAQIISQMKGKNPNITKVVIGSRDKRTEGGTVKTYITYSAHIKTEYPGVTRVYRSQKRYIGNSYDKDLVGSSYYLGMKNPDIETCQNSLNKNKEAFYGNDYSYIVGVIKEPTVNADTEFYWANLNATSFMVSATYLYRGSASSTTIKTITVSKRVGMSRSIDGVKWDPKAELLANGIWNLPSVKKSVSREIIKEETWPAEKLKDLKSLRMQDDIERANNYVANLPTVELPEFKSDRHVIKYIHDLLIEGDKGKIESAMNKLAPNDYFLDRESSLYTNQGAKFVNEIVAIGDWYSTFYCKNPQVKSEKYGSANFYTRDLNGVGTILVYQKKDLTWRVSDVRSPLYKEGFRDKEVRLNSLKAAGDSKCGQPLSIEAPAGPVVYKIGDRVEGLSRGVWYAGTVSQIDQMLDDRYQVKFDNINGQWITGDKMRVLDKSAEKANNNSANETPIGTKTSTTSSSKIETPSISKKTKTVKKMDKLKGLKNKVKLP